MLQFCANANTNAHAHANVEASVNEPLLVSISRLNHDFLLIFGISSDINSLHLGIISINLELLFWLLSFILIPERRTDRHTDKHKQTCIFSRAVCYLTGNIFGVEISCRRRADDVQMMCRQRSDDVWMTWERDFGREFTDRRHICHRHVIRTSSGSVPLIRTGWQQLCISLLVRNKVVFLPVCTLSPVFNSDIATCFPFPRVTVAVDGKHFLQQSANPVPQWHFTQSSQVQHTWQLECDSSHTQLLPQSSWIF